MLVMSDATAAREVQALAAEIARELGRRLGEAPPRVRSEALRTEPAREPRPPVRAEPLAQRPLTAEALKGVEDPVLRRRLARWAGVQDTGDGSDSPPNLLRGSGAE